MSDHEEYYHDVHNAEPREQQSARGLIRGLRQLALDPQTTASPDLHTEIITKAQALPPPRRWRLTGISTWLGGTWDISTIAKMAVAMIAGILLTVFVRPNPVSHFSLTNSKLNNQDKLANAWILVNNDNMEAQKAGQFIPSQRTVELLDQHGEVTGSFQTETGRKQVRGFRHQSHLVLSYASENPELAGAGVWIMEGIGDTSSTYIGYAIGYNCELKKMTRCRAALTKDVDLTKVYSMPHLHDRCQIMSIDELDETPCI
jgi:hypothetical protein